MAVSLRLSKTQKAFLISVCRQVHPLYFGKSFLKFDSSLMRTQSFANKASFFLRLQPFNCFSKQMACFMCRKVSDQRSTRGQSGSRIGIAAGGVLVFPQPVFYIAGNSGIISTTATFQDVHEVGMAHSSSGNTNCIFGELENCRVVLQKYSKRSRCK